MFNLTRCPSRCNNATTGGAFLKLIFIMLYHCIYTRSFQDGRHDEEYIGSKECDNRPEGRFDDDNFPFSAEWDEWVTNDELPTKYPKITIKKIKLI